VLLNMSLMCWSIVACFGLKEALGFVVRLSCLDLSSVPCSDVLFFFLFGGGIRAL